MTTSASALDQGQRLGDVTPVAGREVEADRAAQAPHRQVDLGADTNRP